MTATLRGWLLVSPGHDGLGQRHATVKLKAGWYYTTLGAKNIRVHDADTPARPDGALAGYVDGPIGLPDLGNQRNPGDRQGLVIQEAE